MQYRALAFLSAALVAGGFACGSGSNGNNSSPSTTDGGEEGSMMMQETGAPETGGGEASMDAEAPYPAVTPTDVPQVADAGGPVMSAPKVVPIFYANDDSATITTLKDFLSKLPASKWWAGWIPEYGVGALTVADPIVITDTLPPYWDDSQIQADLAARLTSGSSGFPAPDANTIYAYFFPAGVTITTNGTPDPTDGGAFDGGGGAGDSCVGYYGYHDNITLNAPADGGAGGMDVSYAVMPRCPAAGGMSVVDIVTSTASHEFAEAATDPFPSTNPAFSTVDRPHFYWSRALGGGEVGDMCAQNGTAFTTWPDLPYLVQRIWSNKAAKAGTDPCIPVPQGSVYFQSYPKMPDMVTVNSRGGMITALGAEIAVGQSKTIEIDLASSGPTSGAWQVRPLDAAEFFGTTTYLNFAFQECNGAAICTGQNGSKLHLTVTLMSAPRRGYDEFLLESRYQADGGGPMAGEYTFWAGLVAAPPSDAGTGPMDSGGGG
ncbi:MAG TPA: hypothetical protein VF737_04240 [Gemmatimonadaceae bacterium]